MSSLNRISGDQLGWGEKGEVLLHLPHPFLKQAFETVFLNFKGPRNRFQGLESPAYVAWRAGKASLFLLGS